MKAVPTEWFIDSVAFSRAVMNRDEAGAQTIIDLHDDVAEIMLPQSYLIGALVSRLAQVEDMPEDVVWGKVMETIERIK